MEGNLPQRFAPGISTPVSEHSATGGSRQGLCSISEPLSCMTVPHRPLKPVAADVSEHCSLTIPRLRPGMDGLDKTFECLFPKKQEWFLWFSNLFLSCSKIMQQSELDGVFCVKLYSSRFRPKVVLAHNLIRFSQQSREDGENGCWLSCYSERPEAQTCETTRSGPRGGAGRSRPGPRMLSCLCCSVHSPTSLPSPFPVKLLVLLLWGHGC